MEVERLEQTRRLLQEEHTVRVDHLADLFQVSPMTIRRDLEKLAAEDWRIRRCRGGAVLVTDVTAEEPYPTKQVQNLEEKQEIARRAYALLRPGILLYLDAGTTCYEVASLLVSHPVDVEVVTNDMHSGGLLAESGFAVTMTGGSVERQTACLIGDFAEHTVSRFCFDLAFLGATSINENYEVSTPTLEKAALKQLVLSRSEQAYLLADHTKFFRHSHYAMYPLAEFDGVFTGQDFARKNEDQLRERNITVL